MRNMEERTDGMEERTDGMEERTDGMEERTDREIPLVVHLCLRSILTNGKLFFIII